MTADFNVILNFNSAKPVITGAEFKAGDKGFTINMDVRELDPTGMTPKIAFYRSNATSVESSAVTNVGNIFSYTLLGNELAVPGIVVADLKFYDGDDQRISSASFIFSAIADTLDGLGGGTESYSDELEQLSAEFQDTLDDYIDAFGNTAPINPRGDYDNTATYEPRDMVYDSNTGTSWVCKQESTGHAPTNGSAYWQKLVDSSGGGGTDDYDDLENKPKINNVTLSGNKTTADLGITIPTKTKDLDDVASTTPTNGQILKFNSTSGKYEPANESGGGGSAADITYDNTVSKLSATRVQGAIDEVNGAMQYLYNNTGGKNQIPYPYNHTSFTLNGITFTDIGDGTIKVGSTNAQTATSDTYFAIHILADGVSISKGHYIVNGCPNGGGANTYEIAAVAKRSNDTTIDVTYEYGNGETLDSPDEDFILYAHILIHGGITIPAGGIIFKPMLRDASISDDTYVPYAMTNRELTGKVKGIISAATNASDFAAFKAAIANL